MVRLAAIASVLLLALILAPAATQAGIIQHDSKAGWLAAVGGSADISEDFSGFSSDTSFVSSAVAISMGTLAQTTLENGFRNIVDVPPLAFGDNGGTAHASMFTNFPELPGDGSIVKLAFTTPVTAWGADFFSVLSGETLAIDVFSPAGASLATLTPATSTTFLGFVGDAGETSGWLIFRSATLTTGSGGEGFGMDDLVATLGEFEVIPEPSTFVLLACGLLTLGVYRRRQQRKPAA